MTTHLSVNLVWHVGTRAEEAGSPAGQPFATDTAGRPAPNPRIQREADDYNAAHGLPPINHDEYIDVNPERARRIADLYDDLPMDDSANPAVRRSYEALAREVKEQWDFVVAHGMTLEPMPDGEDPYKTSFDVATDVRDHRHLYFYQGEPNALMAAVDPKTGYRINDKFRAIHDYFGHCASGYGFGPRGDPAGSRHATSLRPSGGRRRRLSQPPSRCRRGSRTGRTYRVLSRLPATLTRLPARHPIFAHSHQVEVDPFRWTLYERVSKII